MVKNSLHSKILLVLSGEGTFSLIIHEDINPVEDFSIQKTETLVKATLDTEELVITVKTEEQVTQQLYKSYN